MLVKRACTKGKKLIPAMTSFYCTLTSPVLKGASPRPFSDIPVPKGSLPVLGHYFRIKDGFNTGVKKMFEEVRSPIFKLKLPGMTR